jgi:hypothetical protein
VAEQQGIPTFDAVRELVRDPSPPAIPRITQPVLDLGIYDRLLVGATHHA